MPGKVTEHRLRCKVVMNGSPIEEKVDHLMNNSMHTTTPTPNVADRLLAIENKVWKSTLLIYLHFYLTH